MIKTNKRFRHLVFFRLKKKDRQQQKEERSRENCLVQLKSVLFDLFFCVFDLFFQNAGSQLCFRFFSLIYVKNVTFQKGPSSPFSHTTPSPSLFLPPVSERIVASHCKPVSRRNAEVVSCWWHWERAIDSSSVLFIAGYLLPLSTPGNMGLYVHRHH